MVPGNQGRGGDSDGDGAPMQHAQPADDVQLLTSHILPYSLWQEVVEEPPVHASNAEAELVEVKALRGKRLWRPCDPEQCS